MLFRSSLGQALREGGRGRLSPARLLNLPYVGYLPILLGAAGCHQLTALLHLCNAILFRRILRRLDWPDSRATAAAAIFLTSPWIAQATMWWSASPAVVATLLFLAGVEFYLRSAAPGRRGAVCLAAAAGCFFLQLLFYELWTAGVVLLAAIEMRRPGGWRGRCMRLGVASLAGVAYAAWRLAAHHADVNQDRKSTRLPVTQ